jgi:hypothetical protein
MATKQAHYNFFKISTAENVKGDYIILKNKLNDLLDLVDDDFEKEKHY